MTLARGARARAALLTHGFASSWEHGWEQLGWPDLLADAGMDARPFALPGHVGSTLGPRASIDEIAAAALETCGDADVALGFSLGSAVTLHAAVADPDHFERIVLLGFGDGAWQAPEGATTLADRLEDFEIDDPDVTLLRRSARSAGDDLGSIIQFLRSFPGPPRLDELHAITADVLIVLGEHDTMGPATRASAAFRSSEVVTLSGVDHWRTPGSQAAMAAVLDFLS